MVRTWPSWKIRMSIKTHSICPLKRSFSPEGAANKCQQRLPKSAEHVQKKVKKEEESANTCKGMQHVQACGTKWAARIQFASGAIQPTSFAGRAGSRVGVGVGECLLGPSSTLLGYPDVIFLLRHMVNCLIMFVCLIIACSCFRFCCV